MTITAKRLEGLRACSHQIATFRAIWGEGPAPMTIEAAVENAEKFSWDWAATKMLSPEARAEYNRATDAARAAVREEYKRAIDEAWAEYKRATAPARADYNRAIARAFAEAYIRQEGGE